MNKNLDKFLNKKVLVKQIRSVINSDKSQKATIRGLGLRGIGSASELKCTNSIKGMLEKISHLIEIKEI